MDRAVAFARHRDIDAGLAVLDTRTGQITTAGYPSRLFPAASVTKALIATQVLLNGQMKGEDAELAYTMITESDNDDAYALYPQVGADQLVPKIARHYDIPDLGLPPAYPGTFGSTRFRALGLVRLYGAIRKDPKVWPWLSNAMHHFEAESSADEPNDFGLAELPDAAVKNGWNVGRDKAHPDTAEINSTGFVDHDRYAVVILTEAPGSYYYAPGETVVSKIACTMFPHCEPDN